MPQQEFTQEQLDQMRQILATHGAAPKPMTTVDLNNPKVAPYRFQKFPMAVYDHLNSYQGHDEERVGPNGRIESFHVAAKITSRIVQSEKELQSALADGWVEEAPEFREVPEQELSGKFATEAARVQQQIEATRPKRGPGRPPRVAAE